MLRLIGNVYVEYSRSLYRNRGKKGTGVLGGLSLAASAQTGVIVDRVKEDIVKLKLMMVGVKEEAEDRVRWRHMIHCGDT